MSKKKNTLKDLDEFLKQQAASLAPTSKLNEKVKDSSSHGPPSERSSISVDEILRQLEILSHQEKNYRTTLYDIIIDHLESLDQQIPEDIMLINTALYLKYGSNWKEEIRKYWKEATRKNS